MYDNIVPELRCKNDARVVRYPFCVKDVMLKEFVMGEEKKVLYGIDTWIPFINEHIKEDLTIDRLAGEFHYSPSYFRHAFQLYYDISVSDYIRRRRVRCAAREIRAGKKPEIAAEEYGFRSRDGFNRAFKKEFSVSPSRYGKGRFEMMNPAEYYAGYNGRITVSYLKINELKILGHSVLFGDVLPGEDGTDLSAQLAFWADKDFPAVKTTRKKNNTEIREDKIAMWHREDGGKRADYILGSVVEDLEDVPEGMTGICLCAGEYAIFETTRSSDREVFSETIRMFSRCVLNGWINENKEKLDGDRVIFERYINDKVYIYVPLKENYRTYLRAS